MKLKKDKLHIIYVMTFTPKYEFYHSESEIITSTIHHWINKDNLAIGIWKQDWSWIIGSKIIELHPNISWEVWRPDFRADKIYSHTFENGLVFKIFPATNTSMWSGIRKTKGLSAPLMGNELDGYINNNTDQDLLLFLPVTPKPVSFVLQKKFQSKIPILNTHFLYSKNLLGKIEYRKKPLRLIHDNAKALQLSKYMQHVKTLMVGHKEFIPQLKEKYKMQVFFNTVGVNHDFWKPDITKEDAREELSIQGKKHVFLFSSRLVPEYQIDKVLAIVGKLRDKNIYCIFTSTGSTVYVDYLKSLVQKYKIEDKVDFTGYVDEQTLKLYYCACDTFFMTSIINAGPLSTIYAMLMERPVITTKPGLAAEILIENSSGLIVQPKDYIEWYNAMNFSINKGHIKTVDRNIVKVIFNWETIADQWMNIFNATIANWADKNNY